MLAAGKGVVASHASSVCLYGVGEVPACHEVSGPLRREVRMKGVIGHRTGFLEARDVTTRSGIPCTSAVRTVIDMSGRLTVEALGRLVDEMVRRRLLTLPERRSAEAPTGARRLVAPLTFTWRMSRRRDRLATLDEVFDRATGEWRPSAHKVGLFDQSETNAGRGGERRATGCDGSAGSSERTDCGGQ